MHDYRRHFDQFSMFRGVSRVACDLELRITLQTRERIQILSCRKETEKKKEDLNRVESIWNLKISLYTSTNSLRCKRGEPWLNPNSGFGFGSYFLKKKKKD